MASRNERSRAKYREVLELRGRILSDDPPENLTHKDWDAVWEISDRADTLLQLRYKKWLGQNPPTFAEKVWMGLVVTVVLFFAVVFLVGFVSGAWLDDDDGPACEYPVRDPWGGWECP